MSSHESSFMEESRIEFENTPVRVIPTRDLDELSLGERKIGPFTSGREVEIPFWMAEELAKAGLVKFRDEYMVDLAALSKIQWLETVPSSRRITALPENFYPILRRFLSSLLERSRADHLKMRDYEKALTLSRDILNCRLRKIVALAATPLETDEMVKNMSSEEKLLYRNISEIVNVFREDVLRLEGSR